MKINVGGLETRVEQLGGSGEHLLLLHGWGPRSVSLEKNLLPLAERLKARYRLTLVDFPGHGGTQAQEAHWGVPEYAAWTLQVMDALGLKRVTILAHSFGGRVALYLAAGWPERVHKLVLTGCAGLRDKRGIKARSRAMGFKIARAGLELFGKIPALKAVSARALAGLRAGLSSADYLMTPENLRGSFSKIVRQDLRPLLGDIAQPTLLVWGEKDAATPLWMGEVMAREMPRATLLVYQGDDHWAYQNQPARFANAVEAFMEEDFLL
ncbi:MAG: alpha/beta fold hydrolase [Christensenellales bacterium]